MGMILRAHFSEFMGLNRLDKFVLIALCKILSFSFGQRKLLAEEIIKANLQKICFHYSRNQKTVEYEDDIIVFLKCILCCLKQIANLKVNTLLIKYNGSAAVPHVHCAIKSHKLSLKVDFLFQSFLVITVKIQNSLKATF